MTTGHADRQPDYLAVNLANWDERVPAHVASPGYAVQRFLDDPAYLSDVVTFDLPRLGDLRGLRGVHLQCHIGTDTISLARLGAIMTGLDFSPAAIRAAQDLSERCGLDIRFVETDVYSALNALPSGGFDLVFTGVGALCWLPDIRRWAYTVADLLGPGGRLFLREGHPMLWAMAEPGADGALIVDYPYFERAEPVVWTEAGTYVETDVQFAHNTTHEWNHGLGELISALLDAGLRITGLVEHDSVPWEALAGVMTPAGGGEWRLTTRPWRLAASYTLQAVKDR